MDELLLIGLIASILTTILGIISLYFRSRYHIFKDVARNLVDTADKMIDMIEDDKITDDELNELITHMKCLVVSAQKLLGLSQK